MHPWLIWTILAAGLAAAEALSLDLVLIMCAGGAATGAIAAGFGLSPAWQVAVAVATALALLLAVRPVAQRHLTGHGTHISGTAALVGREAVTMTVVDGRTGRVRLNGAEWSARSFDPSQTIVAGSTVRVMEIDGATAVVWDAENA